MRTFKKFPDKTICPICNTNDNKECLLIPIDGTKDGNICEAQPAHVECFASHANMFRMSPYKDILYMMLGEEA